jgi:four helix bundle protein
MKENVVKNKSFAFALRVVKLAKFLQNEKKEFVLSKQVLRSGTAIGALVREAEHAESKADFTHKMNIALKEANETLYWLDLLHQAEYITDQSCRDGSTSSTGTTPSGNDFAIAEEVTLRAATSAGPTWCCTSTASPSACWN